MEMQSLYNQGEEAYVQGDYVLALTLFRQEWERGHSGDCLNYLGCCHLSMGEYPSAITCFETLRKKSPEWERPVFNLGRVYFKMGETGKALQYYEAALAMNPGSEDAHYYMGTYYEGLQDYERARQSYEQSIRLNEGQAEPHLNLGMCYFRMSEHELALKEFERAYELDPSCYDAVRNKGFVLLRMSEIKLALDAFELAVRMKPEETECLIDIIYCNAKLGNYETALTIAYRLRELEPGNERVMRFIEKLRISLDVQGRK